MSSATSFSFRSRSPIKSQAKKRPAVIVSSAAYNAERPDVIIMAVTSQVRPENTFDIPVAEWQAAGLIKPSVVKPVIAMIEKSLVIKQLGRLSEQDRATLAESLKAILR